MHELSIARSIIAIAEQAVPADAPGFVSGVTVQVGELSSIEVEALRFAFDAIKDDSRLSKAELLIDLLPGEAVCTHCGTIFVMHNYTTPCPACERYAAQVTKGKELKVLSITMEEAPVLTPGNSH
jgi:hydrogenase nickel incorporation protein HypA/HybF